MFSSGKWNDCLQCWKVIAADVSNLFLSSGGSPMLSFFLMIKSINSVTCAARFKLVHMIANGIFICGPWL